MPPRALRAFAKGGAMGLFRIGSEPTEKEKRCLMTFIAEVPFLLRKVYIELAREMPHKDGGAPRKLRTPEIVKRACEGVSRLLGLG